MLFKGSIKPLNNLSIILLKLLELFDFLNVLLGGELPNNFLQYPCPFILINFEDFQMKLPHNRHMIIPQLLNRRVQTAHNLIIRWVPYSIRPTRTLRIEGFAIIFVGGDELYLLLFIFAELDEGLTNFAGELVGLDHALDAPTLLDV